MNWQRPDFIEINMSAEIGGYQSDDRPSDIPGPAWDALPTNEEAAGRESSRPLR
jgi:hypothetical protein